MNVILFLIFFLQFYLIKSISTKFKLYLNKINLFLSIPKNFQPIINSKQHQNTSTVIFTVAMGGYSKIYLNDFLGTLRKIGYNDDVVIAINNEINDDFIQTALKYSPIIYKVPYCDKKEEKNEINNNENIPKENIQKKNIIIPCTIDSLHDTISINMIRYLFYQWWATKYSEDTVIFLTDFRDVIFQSNPFSYLKQLWYPPVAQLTVFLEPLPQKVNILYLENFLITKLQT